MKQKTSLNLGGLLTGAGLAGAAAAAGKGVIAAAPPPKEVTPEEPTDPAGDPAVPEIPEALPA